MYNIIGQRGVIIISDRILNNECFSSSFYYDYGYKANWSYKTDISAMAGGGEQRRARWDSPLRKFSLPFNNKTIPQLQTLLAFFHDHKGAYESFYFWDNDNTALWTVTAGYKEITGSSVDAINTEWRPIIKPENPINLSHTPNFTTDVIVKIDGTQRTTGMTIYPTSGRITFDNNKPSSSSVITIQFSYLVRVRFATDAAEMTGVNYNIGAINLELQEVR